MGVTIGVKKVVYFSSTSARRPVGDSVVAFAGCQLLLPSIETFVQSAFNA